MYFIVVLTDMYSYGRHILHLILTELYMKWHILTNKFIWVGRLISLHLKKSPGAILHQNFQLCFLKSIEILHLGVIKVSEQLLKVYDLL